MRSHSDGAKKLQKEVKELTEQLRRITATEKQVDKKNIQSSDHKNHDTANIQEILATQLHIQQEVAKMAHTKAEIPRKISNVYK